MIQTAVRTASTTPKGRNPTAAEADAGVSIQQQLLRADHTAVRRDIGGRETDALEEALHRGIGMDEVVLYVVATANLIDEMRREDVRIRE